MALRLQTHTGVPLWWYMLASVNRKAMIVLHSHNSLLWRAQTEGTASVVPSAAAEGTADVIWQQKQQEQQQAYIETPFKCLRRWKVFKTLVNSLRCFTWTFGPGGRQCLQECDVVCSVLVGRADGCRISLNTVCRRGRKKKW